MKKTLISLATASLIASTAMAADKGIDFVTTGQAVLYYQTSESGAENTSLFNQDQSSANVGVQLNLNADIGNDFALGSQLTYLGTLGLENNLVGNSRQQSAATNPEGSGVDTANRTTDQLMLTKIFVAKKIANTTVKLGRQELPKNLSPLAFTEGWNVFKNTFDAAVVINSDLPDTTLVGAYVGNTSGHDLSEMDSLNAYMLTAQNKSISMATITASYYRLTHTASAIWADVAIAGKDLPLGLKVGLQGGSITPDGAGGKDTSAMGVKVSIKPIPALTACIAYSTVNDGTLAVHNYGTGVKTPLYTQMVANQGSIKHDNDTIKIKGAYSLGDAGQVIVQVSKSTDNSAAKNDLLDAELLYIVKAGGVKFLAAYVMKDTTNAIKNTNIIRLWARKSF